jgi:hypothetical protein
LCLFGTVGSDSQRPWVAGGQKMISLSDIASSLPESWIEFGSVFLVGFWDLPEQS